MPAPTAAPTAALPASRGELRADPAAPRIVVPEPSKGWGAPIRVCSVELLVIMVAAVRDSGVGSAALAPLPPVRPKLAPMALTELPTKLTAPNRLARASLAMMKQSNRSMRPTAAIAARLPVDMEKSRIMMPARVSRTTLLRKMLM